MEKIHKQFDLKYRNEEALLTYLDQERCKSPWYNGTATDNRHRLLCVATNWMPRPGNDNNNDVGHHSTWGVRGMSAGQQFVADPWRANTAIGSLEGRLKEPNIYKHESDVPTRIWHGKRPWYWSMYEQDPQALSKYKSYTGDQWE